MKLVWSPLPTGSRLDRRTPNSLFSSEFDGLLPSFFRMTSYYEYVCFPPIMGPKGRAIIACLKFHPEPLGSSLTLSVCPFWLMLNGKGVSMALKPQVETGQPPNSADGATHGLRGSVWGIRLEASKSPGMMKASISLLAVLK